MTTSSVGFSFTPSFLPIKDTKVAPYGQEEVAEIESIFEVKHIVDTAVLLNITCVCPSYIGVIHILTGRRQAPEAH